MGCPFFEPREILVTGPWTHKPRLPLGDSYSGLCHAGVATAQDPRPEPSHHDLCNEGYARGRCEHFPASCQPDAVRFSIVSEQPLRLVYILEKDHAPLEHGELEHSELDARLLAPNPILAAQARAFLRSTLGPEATPCTCT